MPDYYDLGTYSRAVSAVARGETVERTHVKALLDQALARAYVPIRASCLCRAQAA